MAHDVGFGGQRRLDFPLVAEQRPHLVERHQIVGVGHGQRQLARALVQRDRQHGMALGDILGDELDGSSADQHPRQVYAILAQVLRQRFAQGGVGDEAETHHFLAQRRTGAFLLEQGDA